MESQDEKEKRVRKESLTAELEKRDSSVANATSDLLIDLMTRLETQEQEIKRLKAARENFRPTKITPDDASSVIKRDDHPGPGGGWVVETPLEWSGVRSTIRFVAGVGIIDESLENADYLAHLFEHDYKYKVTPATADQLSKIRRMREVIGVSTPMTVNEKLMTQGGIR